MIPGNNSCPAHAAAVGPSSVPRLEPYVIHGREESLFGSTKAELERRPSSVVIIQEDEVKKSRGYNLEDVFQFAPGVYFQSKGGASEGQFSIRGTNLSSNFSQWGVTLLLNGLPMNTADGFFTFDAVDLAEVEDVLRSAGVGRPDGEPESADGHVGAGQGAGREEVDLRVGEAGGVPVRRWLRARHPHQRQRRVAS